MLPLKRCCFSFNKKFSDRPKFAKSRRSSGNCVAIRQKKRSVMQVQKNFLNFWNSGIWQILKAAKMPGQIRWSCERAWPLQWLKSNKTRFPAESDLQTVAVLIASFVDLQRPKIQLKRNCHGKIDWNHTTSSSTIRWPYYGQYRLLFNLINFQKFFGVF